MRGLASLRRLLPDALGRDEVVRAGQAQRTLRRWREAVGDALADRSAPDRYDKGIVWVAVAGSAWAQELRLRKDDILDRLRSMAGDRELFKDLRFGVRPFDLMEPPKPAPPPKEKPAPDDRSIREIAEARLRDWNETRD